MKIISIKSLALSEVKVVKFGRFADHRGYFAEHFRTADINANADAAFLHGLSFLQWNESFSHARTVRGLHVQLNPAMGKLVRTVAGHMVDFALDIRKRSPNFGKIIAYDMLADSARDYGEWIWIPPGFAHGNFFLKESVIEYFCTAVYNPAAEVGISPLAPDLDWSLCDSALRESVKNALAGDILISDKDRNGRTISKWKAECQL